MPAEMDLRKGGFVPLGKKERADDVPARLSKNEFVFTAKAVRNAGGGDVKKGAKKNVPNYESIRGKSLICQIYQHLHRLHKHSLHHI